MKAPPREPADLFRTFADTTRLRILNLLLKGELCVCDLSEILGEIQPKVSRHLAILRRVELVQVRREGKRKFYSLSEDPPPLHQTLIRCVGSCLSEFEVLQLDRRRLASMGARLHRASGSGASMANRSALDENGALAQERC
jgi:ArsR family transcriptional regulator